ncbi:hypothetical protein E3T43_07065 [Cryobacterium sp. Hh7]|uniref:hypothetical protein n=1 Tax=Cryobacterium sp. Hh7 TaxID=1259159 RepID=UPI00106B4160|nr:hypothetical protein [Cryobacterium sp. Hh7]TFD58002.1 hypothetical protein E3T43_07065 [Cryobacterium sp. Hh7]
MTTHADAPSVVRAAEKTLSFARQGLTDYLVRKERTQAGLHNAIIHGRSVTFVLQNLKNLHPDFEKWYEIVASRLRADPKARWFVELRNRIEKQGQIGDSHSSFKMYNFDSSKINTMNRDAPSGTVSMFFGDSMGRSGWEVLLPDGSLTEVFFELPLEIATFQLSMAEAPEGFSFEKDLPDWLDQLEAIVQEARSKFGGASN